MSVIFSITAPEDKSLVLSTEITCGCDNKEVVTLHGDIAVEEFMEAYEEESYQFEGCADPYCLEYGPEIIPVEGAGSLPTVKVSNALTIRALKELGYGDENLSGKVDPKDFLAKIAHWGVRQWVGGEAQDTQVFRRVEGIIESLENLASTARTLDLQLQWA